MSIANHFPSKKRRDSEIDITPTRITPGKDLIYFYLFKVYLLVFSVHFYLYVDFYLHVQSFIKKINKFCVL